MAGLEPASNHNFTNAGSPPSVTSLLVSKTSESLEFVQYLDLLHGTCMTPASENEFLQKVKQFMMAIPNLKGVFNREEHSSFETAHYSVQSLPLPILDALQSIVQRQTLTHLDLFPYSFVDYGDSEVPEEDLEARTSFANNVLRVGPLKSLRVVNINLSECDIPSFEFGALKNLVYLDVLYFNVVDIVIEDISSFSDILASFPTSLRVLTLETDFDIFNDPSLDIQSVEHHPQLVNLQRFNFVLDVDVGTQMGRLPQDFTVDFYVNYSWFMPNLIELSLGNEDGDTVIFTKNNTPGFLNAVFQALTKFVALSFYEANIPINFNFQGLHTYLTHVTLATGQMIRNHLFPAHEIHVTNLTYTVTISGGNAFFYDIRSVPKMIPSKCMGSVTELCIIECNKNWGETIDLWSNWCERFDRSLLKRVTLLFRWEDLEARAWEGHLTRRNVIKLMETLPKSVEELRVDYGVRVNKNDEWVSLVEDRGVRVKFGRFFDPSGRKVFSCENSTF
ncbi:hypothetical protein HDU76_009331 [Blyttiomyces sp. JEL0837]|nr:hypothetical protein HDU76_009331 [Blyttiomyces sp. JEL0837]